MVLRLKLHKQALLYPYNFSLTYISPILYFSYSLFSLFYHNYSKKKTPKGVFLYITYSLIIVAFVAPHLLVGTSNVLPDSILISVKLVHPENA